MGVENLLKIDARYTFWGFAFWTCWAFALNALVLAHFHQHLVDISSFLFLYLKAIYCYNILLCFMEFVETDVQGNCPLRVVGSLCFLVIIATKLVSAVLDNWYVEYIDTYQKQKYVEYIDSNLIRTLLKLKLSSLSSCCMVNMTLGLLVFCYSSMCTSFSLSCHPLLKLDPHFVQIFS